MTKITVKPGVFEWAIERSGLTLASLKKKFPNIEKWRNGSALPTLKQLEAFANRTAIPLGFLLLGSPPESAAPIPFFRTESDGFETDPSLDLLRTIQLMRQRQEWARDYFKDLGREALPFVGSAQIDETPESVARRMRTTLGINEGWGASHSNWSEALSELQMTLEAAGVLVFVNGIVENNTHRKLSPKEFRGFVLVDPHAPLVFVNGADAKAAQMFTLAHELAHIFYGSSAAFDLRNLQPSTDAIELACNAAAAEFLVPQSELQVLWRSLGSTEDKIEKVARHFKVSSLVAARRTLDINLMNYDQFIDFYEKYLRKEKTKKKSSGGDFYASQNLRIGRKFGEAIVRAVGEGKILYSDAYRLTGLRGASFSKFAKLKIRSGE